MLKLCTYAWYIKGVPINSCSPLFYCLSLFLNVHMESWELIYVWFHRWRKSEMPWRMKWGPSFDDRPLPILIIYEMSSRCKNRNWSMNLSRWGTVVRLQLSPPHLHLHLNLYELSFPCICGLQLGMEPRASHAKHVLYSCTIAFVFLL